MIALRLLAVSLAFTALSSVGQGQQLYRSHQTPLNAVRLTAAQRRKIDALDRYYQPRLVKLRQLEKSGKDVSDDRDALNRKYSKALLAVMTSAQKTVYLEAVYRHVEDFLATHKGVSFEDVFVWGGAYAKKPSPRTEIYGRLGLRRASIVPVA